MIKRREKLEEMRSDRKAMLLFALMFVLFAAFCFQYYQELSLTIREESKGYLQEIARRIGSNINRVINDNFAVLNTMAVTLSDRKVQNFTEVQSLLQKQQSYWNYKSILLIDENGRAYDLENNEVFLALEEKVGNAIIARKQTMSTTQVINNCEYSIFFVPLEDVEIDGKKMIALAASYNPALLNKVLSMGSFSEQAYSQIITKSGITVTRPSFDYAMPIGYNVFSSLQKAELDDGESIQMLQKNIASNKANQIGFKLQDKHYYMVYTPIEPNDWYLLTFVPVQVVNQKSDMLLRTTLLVCSIITFAFAMLIAIIVYIFNANKRRLEHIAYIDEITNGNTIQRFYEIARTLLDDKKNRNYAVIYTNLKKFKVMNEQIGRLNCDMMLKHMSNSFRMMLNEWENLGRLSADNFCLLMEYQDERILLSRMEKWHEEINQYVQNNQPTWNLPVMELGIYVVDNKDLTLPQMIDRAKLALQELTYSLDNKLHYAFYDDKVRCLIFREKQLEDQMESALKNEEFQVYLQPKQYLPEDCIGGAEALVRWQSPTEGMIFPNEFIPLFEKNGFIVQLDLWVFEQVCRTIHKWKDEGRQVVKISVNCSRIHFKNPLFLQPYIRIADAYGIDKHQIEIEVTESIVLENLTQLTAIIQDIKSTGFSCSMDDFGSGYSSLSLIQNIPVDTLKLDKVFFHSNFTDSKRTEAVVQSIVNMAKALSMETVAEGVEHMEQVDMLKRAGCDYVQGYVFAKPMKISEFEKLTYGE